jgi:hypothetical protein
MIREADEPSAFQRRPPLCPARDSQSKARSIPNTVLCHRLERDALLEFDCVEFLEEMTCGDLRKKN